MITLHPITNVMEGGLRLRKVDLGVLSRRFDIANVSGRADAVATIGGTIQEPSVGLKASGAVRFRPEGQSIDLGTFQLDALYQKGDLKLRRGVVRGPLGLIAANGTVGSSQDLGIGIVGRRLRAGALLPELEGRANLVAQVGGTLRRPTLQGYVEAYEVGYGEVMAPAIRADLLGDRRQVALRGLRATSGTTELTGRATVNLESQALSGLFRAQDLQIGDFAPESLGLAGVLDVPRLTLGGTIQAPTAVASVEGEKLVVRGAKLDRVEASLHATTDAIEVSDSTVAIGGGTVRAQGRYSIKAKVGEATLRAEDVSLEPLARQVSTDVTLDGTISGSATARVLDGQLASLKGNGDLSDIKLNGTAVGDGPWQISKTAGETAIGAELRVGTLETYVQIENGRFDPSAETLGGTLWMHNVPLSDLTSIGDRYLADLTFDDRQAIRSIRGRVDLGLQVQGSAKKPDLTADSLFVSDLQFRSVDLGSIRASFDSRGDLWRLNSLSLQGPLGSAEASGTVDLKGDLDVAAEIRNLSLLELGRVVPGAGAAGGSLQELSVIARGPTESPRIRASASLEGIASRPGEPGISVLLSTIQVNEADGLQVDGNVTYRGFTGTLEARAPFSYREGIPANGQVFAQLDLPDRSLGSVAEYLPSLDAERSKLGNVSGNVQVAGTLNNLGYSGRVAITGPRLAFRLDSSPLKPDEALTVQDALENFNASLEFSEGQLRVASSAKSSRGGDFALNLKSPLGQLGRLADTLQEGGGKGLLDSPLDGTLAINDLAIRQSFGGGSFVGGRLDGTLNFGGTLGAPLISTATPLEFANVDTVVPTFAPSEGTGAPPSINPRFAVQFGFADPARIRTTAAELSVLGDGTLGGSLASPDLRAALQVEGGTLALPGGRVRLEQGGTVDVAFASGTSDNALRADVDLEGRTSLTALRYGTTYERYDISLGVKGNLLEEGGLNLTASSDPPDLSRDRILALLGQTDLLEAIGQDPGSADTERRIRNALVGYALPSLADPITSRFARGLGLDYLNLEYNPFEEASIAFAKSLEGGFIIQGRRQISDPPPGFPIQYEVKLVYRPRRLRGALSRVSLSIGADQDTQLKFAIQYGVRF
jgi:hypothetical protein